MALVTKEEANYREASGDDNCGICRFMNDDGTCQRVQGIVDKQHVCDLFEADAKADSDSKALGGPMAEFTLMSADEYRAAMSTKEINDLPDSDFAYIEPGGDKDADGKTIPRSLRHYPINDEAHVRNALARAASEIAHGDEDAANIARKAMPAIKTAAKKMGIQVDDEDETKSHSIPATAIRADYGTDRNVPEYRVAPRSQFEMREVPDGTGGTNLKFTGFASVTCADHDDDSAAYEMEDWLGPWTESIVAGAFKKTLDAGCDTAFLINHSGITLARTKSGTMKLSEETNPNASPIYGVTGLHTEALLDPQNPLVQQVRSAVERGDLDEMSFAFRVMRQEWNDAYDRRWIGEVSLDKGDTSLVNYGANPHTGGTVALRQKLSPFGTRGNNLDPGRLVAIIKRSQLFNAAYEVRVGKVLSAANASKLQEALDALHSTDDADIPGIVKALQAIDEALDAGQAAISAVLSVADPDGDAGDLEPALTPPDEQKSRLRPSSIPAVKLALAKAM